MVDCDRCKNKDLYCDNCEHAIDFVRDFYEPMTDKEIREQEEKEKKRAYEKLGPKSIKGVFNNSLVEYFRLAKQATSDDPRVSRKGNINYSSGKDVV